MSRKIVIAGNWKMNKTPEETTQLINEIKPAASQAATNVILCVPFVDLPAAIEAAKGSNIVIGAENVHWEEHGAFTGEISAPMLTALGVQYVIVGHSERRQYFGETDTTVNKRLSAALAHKLKVILCVGETLDQREKNIAFETIAIQLKVALKDVSVADFKNIIIAYEPVWAIGTGKTATAEQANEVNHFIRETVASLYGKEAAEKTIVQYGGSMNPKNAADLLAQPDVDGGLLGGASLKPNDLAAILKTAIS